ncbi:MAG TPA: DMT family transporter [Bryobacteraceae bacterium]|nr:DMT family transporter [Bryobacteraceae bacterium]
MTALSERTRAEIALIGVTLIWGSTFVVVKSAIEQASTLVFLALRFSLGSMVLLLVFRHRLRVNPELRRMTLTGGVAAGACLAAAYYFQTLGLRYTTPSKSAFITGLTAVMVPFLAAVVYRKAPRPAEGLGVGIATFGLALLTLPSGHFAIGYGDALTLCCAVVFAGHILVLGRWAPVSSFELLSFSQIAATAVMMLLVCGWAEPTKAEWNWQLVSGVVITGLFSTAIGFTVQAWAQRHTTPTRAALIFTLEPVAAAVTSYLVAGELLSGKAMIGAVLILTGVLLVELKPAGFGRHPLG